MPDDEREKLAVTLARVDERVAALANRLSRIEWLVGVVAVAIIGAIVTAATRSLTLQ